MIFNKKILRLHREYAKKNIYQSDFLIEHAVSGIMENIELLALQPKYMLEMGSKSSHLVQKLSMQYPDAELISTEDEEIDFAPDTFDLIASTMHFHWVDGVEKYLRNLRQILTLEGKLVMNFIASGSLINLAKFLIECEEEAGLGYRPHIMPLPKEEKVQSIFQHTGFKFVVVSIEKIELEYENPITLMKDLKNMGENNALFHDISALPKNVLSKCNAQKSPFLDVINLITVVAGK